MKRTFEIETEDRYDFNAEWVRMALCVISAVHNNAISVREVQPGPTPEQQAVIDSAVNFYNKSMALHESTLSLNMVSKGDFIKYWEAQAAHNHALAFAQEVEIDHLRAVAALIDSQKGDVKP